MNPIQRRYQIDGQREALTVENSSTSATSSVTSLPLKPSKINPETPSRTEGVDEVVIARVPETIIKGISVSNDKDLKEANSTVTTSNALDEAITEAKATEHLVSSTRIDMTFQLTPG